MSVHNASVHCSGSLFTSSAPIIPISAPLASPLNHKTVRYHAIPTVFSANTATILSSKEMQLCNSFDKPNEIKEKSLDVKLSGANELYITVPAMSVVTVEITA